MQNESTLCESHANPCNPYANPYANPMQILAIPVRNLHESYSNPTRILHESCEATPLKNPNVGNSSFSTFSLRHLFFQRVCGIVQLPRSKFQQIRCETWCKSYANACAHPMPPPLLICAGCVCRPDSIEMMCHFFTFHQFRVENIASVNFWPLARKLAYGWRKQGVREHFRQWALNLEKKTIILYTHTDAHTHTYTYIYMQASVCICIYIYCILLL